MFVTTSRTFVTDSELIRFVVEDRSRSELEENRLRIAAPSLAYCFPCGRHRRWPPVDRMRVGRDRVDELPSKELLGGGMSTAAERTGDARRRHLGDRSDLHESLQPFGLLG